jgi:hypothetical protein
VPNACYELYPSCARWYPVAGRQSQNYANLRPDQVPERGTQRWPLMDAMRMPKELDSDL